MEAGRDVSHHRGAHPTDSASISSIEERAMIEL